MKYKLAEEMIEQRHLARAYNSSCPKSFTNDVFSDTGQPGLLDLIDAPQILDYFDDGDWIHPGKKDDDQYHNGTDVSERGAQNGSVHSTHQDIDTGIRGPYKASTPKAQNSELTSGRCATCDSTIKWPRHLDVFRCTVCLMINDLRQSEEQPRYFLHSLSDEKPYKILLRHCNWTNPPEECNDDPWQSLAEQCQPKDTIKNIVDARDFGSASFALNDSLYGDQTCERQQLHDDLLPLPSSWPMGALDAPFGTGPSADALSSSARHATAGPHGVLKQRPKQDSEIEQKSVNVSSDSVFRPLEDYIIRCFRSCDILNESFCIPKPPVPPRSVSESTMTVLHQTAQAPEMHKYEEDNFELDGKTLLLGDVAENGAWWLGKSHQEVNRSRTVVHAPNEVKAIGSSTKLPSLDWMQLHGWYQAVLRAGDDWSTYIQKYFNKLGAENPWTDKNVAKIQSDMDNSCTHLRRTLLKATEALLRRPGRPLKSPGDCRFLLLLLANPLLYPTYSYAKDEKVGSGKSDMHGEHGKPVPTSHETQPTRTIGQSGTRSHTGILKRIFGLMSNVPQESHRQLISWFTRYTDDDFRKLVDLVSGFVTHRLVRQRRRLQVSLNPDPAAILVPEISGLGAGTSAQLHAVLSVGSTPASPEKLEKKLVYRDDWQIRAAAKVMALLFQANNCSSLRRQESTKVALTSVEKSTSRVHRAVDQSRPLGCSGMSKASSSRARRHDQLLPTSAFYNTVLDYCDLVADFEAWENRRGAFSFCQYPIFFSIWAKIRILEHDARRQMEIRARQAFFNSIMSRSAVSQYLLLRVRRDCLVEDSLREVSEIVGSGQEDIKKSLRIAFQGEEGVDAGG
ncbi:MAG: hypothetical protein Q9209_005411 [Squamulea sp. 1 TL-2023]